MRKLTALSAAAVSLAGAPMVQALEWGVVVQEESEYSTNLTRVEDDEIESWIHQPGVQVQAVHSGPAYDLDIDYEVVRELYEDDAFEDETVARGSADLVWRVLPERLDFVANHSRTQSTIRAIEVFTPDNRQETVTTSAGPILRFNPRGEDTIEFQYAWQDRSSEDTLDDAITHEASARYALATSPNNVITFEGLLTQVQYEEGFIPDLEYTTGQVIWERTARDADYRFLGGFTEVERTDLDDVDGFIFDLSVNWRPSGRDDLTLSASREIRDEPVSLRSGDFGDDLFFLVDTELGEVFTNERAGLAWARQIDGRTTLRLAIEYDEQDYEDAARDVERVGASIGLARQITRNVSFAMGLGYREQEFTDEGEETETTRGNVDVSWQASPRLELALGARYEDRASATSGTGREYDEWVGFLSISYALRPLPEAR